MQVHTTDAINQVEMLYKKYCSASKNAGYGELQVTKLHIPKVQIFKGLGPQQFNKKMRDTIQRRGNRNFCVEYLSSFLR